MAPLETKSYPIEITTKKINRKVEEFFLITDQQGFEMKKKIVIYPFYFKFLFWLVIFNLILMVSISVFNYAKKRYH